VVQRIGIWVQEEGDSEEKWLRDLRMVVDVASRQWRDGVRKELVMASEVYEGEWNERGERHGRGDRGERKGVSCCFILKGGGGGRQPAEVRVT
jgi:hypothetical protein